jgi:hypothetical protein
VGHAFADWSTDSDRDRVFNEAIAACFSLSTRVAVLFHTAESSLVLAASDLGAAAALVLGVLDETLWVVALGGSPALVEVSAIDREVCWYVGPAADDQ